MKHNKDIESLTKQRRQNATTATGLIDIQMNNLDLEILRAEIALIEAKVTRLQYTKEKLLELSSFSLNCITKNVCIYI